MKNFKVVLILLVTALMLFSCKDYGVVENYETVEDPEQIMFLYENGEWKCESNFVHNSIITYINFESPQDAQKAIINVYKGDNIIHTILASETHWLPSQQNIEIKDSEIQIVTESGFIPEGGKIYIYFK